MIRTFAKLILIVIVAFALVGCDGGTRGTGTTTVKGNLRVETARIDSFRVNNIGVMVTVTGSDASGQVLDSAVASTDNMGSFEATLLGTPATIKFDFSSTELQESVEVMAPSGSYDQLEVEFLANAQNKIEVTNAAFGNKNDTTTPNENSGQAGDASQPQNPDSSDTLGQDNQDGTNNQDSNQTPGENNQDGNTNNGDNGSDQNEKITICHVGSKKSTTIEISESSLDAHLEHGDTLGACAE